MPVFNVYLPAERFTNAQKYELSQALPQALNDALDIPADDRFVILTEQTAGNLYLDPSYMGMNRTDNAIVITVLFTAERPFSAKRRLTRAICARVSTVLGISPDDVFIALIPVPKENSSFARGELQLVTDQP